jgi:nucleotide-binding universal stress UspA family protein
MNRADEHEPTIRRIMVALDASPRNRDMIETGVHLAARLGAELIGLFVEDRALLSLATLPFASELSMLPPLSRRMDSARLEREFRAQAHWIQELLARIADREGVPWSFHTTRGDIVAELLRAGTEADLLILGKVGRSLVQRRRMGTTARTLLLQRAGLTMILHETRWTPDPVLMLYDGSPASRKALRAAFRLVETKEVPLRIVILAGDPGAAGELNTTVREKASREGLTVTTRRLARPGLERLAMLIRTQTSGPVIVPCGRDPLPGGEDLCTLLSELPNPVLVVK